MFFVVLLALCAAAFLLGFLSRKMILVALLAAIGMALVAYNQATAHMENPALVAVVQLLCVGLIAASCAFGVRSRKLHTR